VVIRAFSEVYTNGNSTKLKVAIKVPTTSRLILSIIAVLVEDFKTMPNQQITIENKVQMDETSVRIA